MDTQRLAHFRQRLLEERQRYREQIEHINDAGLGQSMTEAYEETALYDNHPADAGTEMFEREKDLGLRSGAQRMLKRIDHALARMEEGLYGICEECGRPIPEERLEAMPMTTLCVDCKAAQEKLPDRFKRPIEEKVLTPPFGRTWRDHGTWVGYDGEDCWQDVAVYGTAEGPQDVPGAIGYNDLYRSLEEPHSQVEGVDTLIDADYEPIGDRARPPWAGWGDRKGDLGLTAELADPEDPLTAFAPAAESERVEEARQEGEGA